MAIEHDYFGLLESGPDGSIFWSENVEFADQSVTVDLTAPDQDAVSEAALDAAARVISAIEDVDLQARNAMIAELHDRTSEVTEFILQQQDELGGAMTGLLVAISGDVHVDVIRSLRLLTMTILAEEYGGPDPFAVLEFALDPDSGDQALLVQLDSDGAIHSISSAD